jgi:hypothetical protein
MALTDTQYVELKTEINTDPKGLGYAGQNDPDVADLLNTIGLVTPTETVEREVINGQELSAVVVHSEYIVLSAEKREAWTVVLSAGDGQIDVSNAGIRNQIAAIWGAGTTTRANLIALQTRDCSRAEALFGAGISISHIDVGTARQV